MRIKLVDSLESKTGSIYRQYQVFEKNSEMILSIRIADHFSRKINNRKIINIIVDKNADPSRILHANHNKEFDVFYFSVCSKDQAETNIYKIIKKEFRRRDIKRKAIFWKNFKA